MQRKPDSVEWILGGVIVVAVLFVWFSSTSSNNSVAIIRMDDIAKETGWDVQAGDVFRKERAAIESDIMRQQQLLKADIDAKRVELGENPTPEQLEILQAMQQQMQSQTMQLRKRSQENLQKIQMQQMQDFVGELQPIILKLSAEGNFTVVLDRTRSNVFYADPATDITDAVIKELQKQSTKGYAARTSERLHPRSARTSKTERNRSKDREEAEPFVHRCTTIPANDLFRALFS